MDIKLSFGRMHSWLLKHEKLSSYVTRPIDDHMRRLKVAKYLTVSRAWEWNRFATFSIYHSVEHYWKVSYVRTWRLSRYPYLEGSK